MTTFGAFEERSCICGCISANDCVLALLHSMDGDAQLCPSTVNSAPSPLHVNSDRQKQSSEDCANDSGNSTAMCIEDVVGGSRSKSRIKVPISLHSPKPSIPNPLDTPAVIESTKNAEFDIDVPGKVETETTKVKTETTRVETETTKVETETTRVEKGLDKVETEPPLISIKTAASASAGGSPRGTNVLKISGCEITFPASKKPFPSQIAVINRTLGAILKSENALIESPTGTGKTIALLASVLAWIRKENDVVKSELQIKTDRDTSGLVYPNPKGTIKDKPKPPKKKQVFYCSRTHSQLQQVIQELSSFEESNEGLKSCILSSRTHTCINEKIKAKVVNVASHGASAGKGQSLDDNCRAAVQEAKCFYANHGMLMNALDRGGGKDLGVWDIEDIVKFGKKHKTCPYFLSRELLPAADIILVPYNFVLDAGIQEASRIDLTDAIIIFDEAHNIEQVARSCSSVIMSTVSLTICCAELLKLSENGSNSFKILYDLMHSLLNWVESYSTSSSSSSSSSSNGSSSGQYNSSNNFNRNNSNSNSNNNRPGSRYGDALAEVLSGEDLLKIFEGVLQLNKDSIEVFDQHFQVIAKESDSVSEILKETRDDSSNSMEVGADGTEENSADDEELKSASKMMIRNFLAVMKMMLQAKFCTPSDFKIAIVPEEQASTSGGRGSYSHSGTVTKKLNIWCMTAGAAFNRINSVCRSIILASGTLAPLSSFQAELGIDFQLSVEAPHVIDVPTQVFSGAVASINRHQLLFTYQNKDNIDLYENLGNILLRVVNITPGGVLMFFPSYAILDKVLSHWKESTGVYNSLLSILQPSSSSPSSAAPAPIPNTSHPRSIPNSARSSNQFFQRSSVSSFNSSSAGPIFVEPRDSKDVDRFLDEYYRLLDAPGSKAVMLAVCRGKVSEGVNFSNEYARTVLVVGIPYPNTNDIQVKLKREYQDNKRIDALNVSKEKRELKAETADKTNDSKNSNSNRGSSSSSISSSSSGSSIGGGIRHLSGSQWYSLQAFRAINQCLGRCIRHKEDFGAVLLLDVRIADAVSDYHQRNDSSGGGDSSSNISSEFDTKNTVGMLSKWVRSRLQRFDEFDANLLLQMKLFFQENVKLRRPKSIYDSFYGKINQIFEPTSDKGKISEGMVAAEKENRDQSMAIERSLNSHINNSSSFQMDDKGKNSDTKDTIASTLSTSSTSSLKYNSGSKTFDRGSEVSGKAKGNVNSGAGKPGSSAKPPAASSFSQTAIGKAFKRVVAKPLSISPRTSILSASNNTPLRVPDAASMDVNSNKLDSATRKNLDNNKIEALDASCGRSPRADGNVGNKRLSESPSPLLSDGIHNSLHKKLKEAYNIASNTDSDDDFI